MGKEELFCSMTSLNTVIFIIDCTAQCNHSEVRILTENSNLKGQVLVCYNKRWAAVCDDIWWDDDAASVVCKQLGYFSGKFGF